MSVKISELTASTGLSSADLIPVVDNSDAQTQKATLQQVLNYVTGSTFNNLTVTSLAGTTAQFTTISASVISASSYIGVPTSSGGTPGGANTTIQFNSGSTFSGSSNLVYDYTTNILSGTTAQFTTITGSTAYFSGNVGIGTSTPTSAKLQISASLLTTTKNAIYSDSTLPNPGSTFEIANYFKATSAGSNNSRQAAFYSDLTPGTTANALITSMWAQNTAAGTGQSPTNLLGSTLQANYGIFYYTAGATSGYNVGASGYSSDSTTRNIGVIGMASARTSAGATTDAIGVYGKAGQHTAGTAGARVAGMFTLYDTDSIGTITDSALIIDNADKNAPILLARDNGSEVFRIADGGNVGIGTSTASYKLDVNGPAGIKEYLVIEAAAGANNDSLLIFNARTAANSNENVARFTADAATGSSDATFKLQMIDADGVDWDDGFTFQASPAGDNHTYVGIGTATPTVRLDVAGNGTTTARFSSGSVIISGNLTVTGTISASNYLGIPTSSLELTKLVVSSSVTLSPAQRAVFAKNNISSSISITLPSVSSADSKEYHIIKADSISGSVIISGSSPNLINGQATYELNGPYQAITLIHDGSDWYVF